MRLVVADAPEFPLYWARELVGEERDAVEVVYGDQTFWLDDEADPENQDSRPGSGWAKVTIGHGGPRFGHRNLTPVPGSVRDR